MTDNFSDTSKPPLTENGEISADTRVYTRTVLEGYPRQILENVIENLNSGTIGGFENAVRWRKQITCSFVLSDAVQVSGYKETVFFKFKQLLSQGDLQGLSRLVSLFAQDGVTEINFSEDPEYREYLKKGVCEILVRYEPKMMIDLIDTYAKPHDIDQDYTDEITTAYLEVLSNGKIAHKRKINQVSISLGYEIDFNQLEGLEEVVAHGIANILMNGNHDDIQDVKQLYLETGVFNLSFEGVSAHQGLTEKQFPEILKKVIEENLRFERYENVFWLIKHLGDFNENIDTLKNHFLCSPGWSQKKKVLDFLNLIKEYDFDIFIEEDLMIVIPQIFPSLCAHLQSKSDNSQLISSLMGNFDMDEISNVSEDTIRDWTLLIIPFIDNLVLVNIRTNLGWEIDKDLTILTDQEKIDMNDVVRQEQNRVRLRLRTICSDNFLELVTTSQDYDIDMEWMKRA